MQLLEGETIIATVNKDRLLLTNLRVIQQPKSGKSLFYKSIYLVDITSISIIKKRINLLLYLTLLMLLFGMSSMIAETVVAGVTAKGGGNLAYFLGAASLLAYLLYSFYTISNISIGTSSLQIDQEISAKDNVFEFIFKVEKAKLQTRKFPLKE